MPRHFSPLHLCIFSPFPNKKAPSIGKTQKHRAMAYVENGVMKSKRSIWRLRTITDFFKSILNFISVFFVTMFSMDKTNEYKKSGKKWDGGPGGGGPGGGGPYGGGGGPRGPRTMSDLRSNDHSSLPACGSCCGG